MELAIESRGQSYIEVRFITWYQYCLPELLLRANIHGSKQEIDSVYNTKKPFSIQGKCFKDIDRRYKQGIITENKILTLCGFVQQ